MKRQLYPADQIETYLFIDLVAFVFLIYHVFTADSPIGLPGSLLLLSLFLGAFYVGLWYRDWRLTAASLFGCGVLSIIAIFYNEFLLLYGIIFADLLGRARRKIHMMIGMCGFVAMYLVTHAHLYGDPFSFVTTVHLPMLILLLLVPIVVRITERSKMLRRELAIANKKLERYIQEEERHRIARDLHDTLGQTLTMMKLKSELAIRLLDKDSEQAKREMNEVMRTSRFALKQVRELVTSMKYVSLDEEIAHGEKLLNSSGIRLSVRETSSHPQLSKMAETMLALSLRECFTNIIKHSQAKNCTVTSDYTDGRYQIHVKDDGIGFADVETDGNGLTSMQERMRLVQGHAHVAVSSSGGVNITLSVPVNERERTGTQ